MWFKDGKSLHVCVYQMLSTSQHQSAPTLCTDTSLWSAFADSAATSLSESFSFGTGSCVVTMSADTALASFSSSTTATFGLASSLFSGSRSSFVTMAWRSCVRALKLTTPTSGVPRESSTKFERLLAVAILLSIWWHFVRFNNAVVDQMSYVSRNENDDIITSGSEYDRADEFQHLADIRWVAIARHMRLWFLTMVTKCHKWIKLLLLQWNHNSGMTVNLAQFPKAARVPL